jgi:cell division protein FtsQ
LTTVTPVRSLRALTRLRLPRLTARRVGAVVVLGLILLGAWLWVRSSSLVAIRQVRITGLAGADAGQVRAALESEAVTMTTLDISTAKLESAISSYPHIAGVQVATHFPHGVTISVDEQIPVATIQAGGRTVAVDGTGLLLPRDSIAGLPGLTLAPDTGGNRVTAAGTLATLAVLAAAPYQLLPHVASAKSSQKHGVAVQLRDGPVLYFGDTTQLAAKWAAADATLANSNSAGASYIDVSAPGKPAAGTGN